MKKTIIAIAMLFSMATNGQDFTGIWQDEEDTSFYIVILYNEDKGYIFSNFSFIEQNTVQEDFVSKKNNKINTTVYNPDNGWRTFIEYKYINKDSIQVKYTGDIKRKSFLHRKEIK